MDNSEEADVSGTGQRQVDEIESLCIECKQNGITKILLTTIPYFKEVAIMSFECTHCNAINNELTPVSDIQEKGVRYKLECKADKDLQRQIVKTEWTEIKIPEIEFEVKRQPGLVTTVEGILERAEEGLKQMMEINPILDDESKEKVNAFLTKLMKCKLMIQDFTIILDDPSGNSYVQSLTAPMIDEGLEVIHYTRTKDQNLLLGIKHQDNEFDETEEPINANEVMVFQTNCPECRVPCFTNMKLVDIPHFKQVILMATTCELCGHKTNEIKSGAGIEPEGVKISLKIKNDEDLKREVVKSDTCNILIPELEMEIVSASAGKYTTVEGLCQDVIEKLEKSYPYMFGDSAEETVRQKLNNIFARLRAPIGLTVILDDPTGNCFIDGADSITNYPRSFEQNEELGLNDMNTDQQEQRPSC